VIAGVFAWLFRLLVARGADFLVAFGLMLLTTLASMIHFLARPHVVSWLLALAWFWILESAEKDGRLRRLWILPVLMVVWVNVHGGFLVGFVLLGIFWVGAAWEWWTTRADRMEDVMRRIGAGRRVRELTWVGVTSTAASLVNPYGWKLHEHVYGYLTNRFLMDHIEEFQSPNFHRVAEKCFAGMILITIMVMARKIPTLRKPRRVGHPITLTAKSAVRMGHPRLGDRQAGKSQGQSLHPNRKGRG
jgi:hypothetical protein